MSVDFENILPLSAIYSVMFLKSIREFSRTSRTRCKLLFLSHRIEALAVPPQVQYLLFDVAACFVTPKIALKI